MRYFLYHKKDGSRGLLPAYRVDEFDFKSMDPPVIKKKKKLWYNDVITFDIETTSIPSDRPYAFMYIWQACVFGVVVYGRSWEDFIFFIQAIDNELNLSAHKLIVYVHNLGFEFQFMYQFCRAAFPDHMPEIFAVRKRKVLSFRISGLEFRCSYLLTNMSLDRACQQEYGCEYLKLTGAMDYKIKRLPSYIMDDMEFSYSMSDVLCLYHMIQARLRNEGDTIATIPMTSTGYIRREMRNASRRDKKYWGWFRRQSMSESLYTMLREASRGGDAGSNRRFTNQLLADCESFDEVSAYPAVMMMYPFPVGRMSLWGDPESLEEFYSLFKSEKNALLFHCFFKNIKIKEESTQMYISTSKLIIYNRDTLKTANGRLVECSFIGLTLTDIDFKLIQRQYDYEGIIVRDVYRAEYAPLPEFIRDEIMKIFREKCELKLQIKAARKEGKDTEYLEYLYAKCKNRLNSIFGLMFTNPVRETLEVTEGGEWVTVEPESVQVELDKYYNNRNNYLQYVHGVWVTAWARMCLYLGVQAFGPGATYWDTDSVKGFDPDFDEIEKLNVQIRKKAEEMGAFCDVGGGRFYLGEFEHETKDAPYLTFITLGAKKYAYEQIGKNGDPDLHITISGVNKKSGALEMGDIRRFREGFIFTEAGKSNSWFNDEEIHKVEIDGESFTSAGNIAILDGTYKLGITTEYMDYLESLVSKR